MENIKFNEMNLSNELKKSIGDLGYIDATEIQYKAIPEILQGHDIIGESQTGTGKTAAFGIPIIDRLDLDDNNLQAVILCPTRELSIQVCEELKKFGRDKKNLKVKAIYGGENIEKQITFLKKGVQIIVGTPGRVMDHLRRNTIKTDTTKMFVLDEADEMLNMGFEEDIITILKDIPNQRQTLLFSATMPSRIINISKKYQSNPKHIKIMRNEMLENNIEQLYFETKEKDKLELLTRLLDVNNPNLSVIFCNTKRKVDDLVEELRDAGYSADGIHGDMKQIQRDRIMKSFRNGSIKILIATDVMARGIDVDDIGIVFNYDLPQEQEYYIHRIGRTGRIGKKGKAFTFVVGKQLLKLREIEKYTKSKINSAKMPTAKQVGLAKNQNIINKIKEILDSEDISKDNSVIDTLLEQNYSSTDIAKAIYRLIEDDISTKRDNSENISKEDLNNTKEVGMTRIFISLGKKDKICAKDVVGSIASNANIRGSEIGKIDIKESFSFADIPSKYISNIIHVMNHNEIKGKKCNVEIANKSQ